MPDFRAFPLNQLAPGGAYIVELETAEPNMTVGFRYALVGCCVDNAAAPPKPLALVVDDNGHFRLVELAKLRSEPTVVNPAP